jgi:hypothetical protein
VVGISGCGTTPCSAGATGVSVTHGRLSGSLKQFQPPAGSTDGSQHARAESSTSSHRYAPAARQTATRNVKSALFLEAASALQYTIMISPFFLARGLDSSAGSGSPWGAAMMSGGGTGRQAFTRNRGVTCPFRQWLIYNDEKTYRRQQEKQLQRMRRHPILRNASWACGLSRRNLFGHKRYRQEKPASLCLDTRPSAGPIGQFE